MANDYSELSKEDLLKVIEKLESHKKYGLIWDEKRTKEKFEKDSENALPVLKEVKTKEIKTDPAKPVNILIEGDNYHALSVLNYTHQGKIDVIYIDPPYNTGAKDWKYNNDYVDKNDTWRHSKWLSMMKKRLLLAKNLLKNNGVILVAIDDHEVHNLRHLLDEIMGENNFISTICIEVNPAGQNIRDNSPAISHDYCLIYAKSIDEVVLILRDLSEKEILTFKEQDEKGRFLWDNLRRRGGNSTPKDRPGQWYPLHVNPKTKKISLKKFAGSVEMFPIDPKGIKRIWRVNPDGFEREYAEGNISVIEKKKGFEIVKKSYQPHGRKPKTLWKEPSHSATSHGTKLLINILGGNVFNYPKSLYLVQDCLKYWADSNAIVLDFFAGSGTTGHAVLDMNKLDGGSRSFILCTNNELNGQEKELEEKGLSKKQIEAEGICQKVTFPRIANVIRGYVGHEKKIDGLGGNLKYYRSAFVKRSVSKDDLKIRITKECTEMLCLREGIFGEVKKTDDYRIFQHDDRIMAVYYSLVQKALKAVKKDLDKMKGKKILYCFTLDPLGLDKRDFRDWKGVSLEPIPQKIIDVYEGIYEY